MKGRIVYSIVLMIIFTLMLFSTTILGAKKEKLEYAGIDDSKGYALFHEQSVGKSIADIYTPEEAIDKMKKLQNKISSIDYFYYYSNISMNGIDDIKIVGNNIISELSPYLLEGKMINGAYHIEDMSSILIPTMVGERLNAEYKIGDIVTGSINGTPLSFQIVGVLKQDCYNENIDADFSSFTIPELYFDCVGTTAKELELQEWFLNSTIGGYVKYNTVDEYNKRVKVINSISDSLGLEWIVEEREDNRFEKIDINIPSSIVRVIFWCSFAIFSVLVVYYLKQNVLKDNNRNLIESSRVIWIENINVLGSYFLVLAIFQFLLKGTAYRKNLIEESGSVLFFLVAYMALISVAVGVKGYRYNGRITNRN